MIGTYTGKFTSIEICAGAGGQALGLEQAGFEHLALVENDAKACSTLKLNRPNWNIIQTDVKDFSIPEFKRIDLIAGGVPCPPFSIAGKQLGHLDERDLFPEAIRLIRECDPRAVLVENVRGLLDKKFENYRKNIIKQLLSLGYMGEWRLLNSSDYGTPQLRPRAILIALKAEYYSYFSWPQKIKEPLPSVGEILYDEMKSFGWKKASEWKKIASGIAPTIVGGSKKHGGPDLGPTRARKAWELLGVDGLGIADNPPEQAFQGLPRLTTKMVALLQGFPKEWAFTGKKTSVYRQIGNAFPPPVAKAIGNSIIAALKAGQEQQHNGTRRIKSKVA